MKIGLNSPRTSSSPSSPVRSSRSATAKLYEAVSPSKSNLDGYVGSPQSLPSISLGCAKRLPTRQRPQFLTPLFVGLLQLISWPFKQMKQALSWFFSHPTINKQILAAAEKLAISHEDNALQMELASIRRELANIQGERDMLLHRLRHSESAGSSEATRKAIKEKIAGLVKKIGISMFHTHLHLPLEANSTRRQISNFVVSVERDLIVLHNSL